MTSTPQRSVRLPREVRPLEVEPLMLTWAHDGVVRATLRLVGHLPVVGLGGALDVTAFGPGGRAIEAALRTRPRYVIVDLAAVTESDRSCVPLLSGMRRKAAWHGAQVWLAAAPEHVLVTLEAARVVDHYPKDRNTARVVDVIRLQQQAPRTTLTAVPRPRRPRVG